MSNDCCKTCEHKARLKAMMPIFEEARDALPAITVLQRELRNISPTLASRMDAIGIAEEWAKHPDNPSRREIP